MPALPASNLSLPLLVATDGSPSAVMAQHLVQPIAHLLQAQASTPPACPALIALTVEPFPKQRRSSPIARLPAAPSPSLPPTEASAAIQSPPLQDWIDRQVRQGRPAPEILNYTYAVQASLIAVGQRGNHSQREPLLGNVATVIARYARCNVLVARGTAAPSWERVLVVVDGSRASQMALAMLRQLIPIGIQQIVLLWVQLPVNANYLFGPFVAPNPSWHLSQSLQGAQKDEGERHLQQAQAVLADVPCEIRTSLVVGDPGPVICQVAQEQQINVILLGHDSTRRSLLPSRKRSNINSSRLLRNARLGVTEDYVIHYAPCSVLLCRLRSE